MSQFIESWLRQRSPDTLGFVQVADDGLLVHLTRDHAAVASGLDAAVAAFRRTAAENVARVAVAYAADSEHSLTKLHELQERIRARRGELCGRGLELTTTIVNPWISRVELIVQVLTEETRQFFEHEFGTGMVRVVEGEGWYGYAPQVDPLLPSTKPPPGDHPVVAPDS
jgi:hypothetical protein